MIRGIPWSARAFAQTGRLILLHPERRPKFASAHREIDLQLHTDPLGVGEARGQGFRVLVVPPLTVWYTLDLSADVASLPLYL